MACYRRFEYEVHKRKSDSEPWRESTGLKNKHHGIFYFNSNHKSNHNMSK